MTVGMSIGTSGLDITPDINVLYLTGQKTIVSKMSDQKLEYFSSSTKVYADWYYKRLHGNYLEGYAGAPGDASKTAVLRRLDVTDLVTNPLTVLAISAIPGLPAKAYMYTEGGKYYLRYSALSAEDLTLTIYAFSLNLPSPKDNVGLVLINSSNNISFDTSRYPMRYVDESKISSGNAYAFICQYTLSSFSYYGGAHYDYGYTAAWEWIAGSCPKYITTDYKVRNNMFLTDAWQWQGGDLWDLDDVFEDSITWYGVESPFTFINVSGYL